MATLYIQDFPDALYEALKARAESEHRGVEQEAVRILTESLETREPLSILELKGLGKELWSATDAGQHVQDERGSWD